MAFTMANTFNLSNGGYLQYQTTTTTTASPNPKPTLVFLHYWGGSIRTWRKVITGLKETYSTVAVNLPGWAGSALPNQDANTVKLTIISQALSVLELLLSLPPELASNGIVLVGHSMGAKVCMAIAATAMKDHNLDLKGMAFVAPAPPTPLVLPKEMRDQQVHAYDSDESVKFTVTNILSSREMLTDEDISIAVEDGLAGSKPAKEAWPSYGMSEEIAIPLGEGRKVIVMAGENDVVEKKERVLVEVVEKLKENGFHVTFNVVEGGRHLIPLENPNAIVDAITQHF
jgi:pimeloyl-ACP methyl ester carboxylesterase